jgi:hypothetical protein
MHNETHQPIDHEYVKDIVRAFRNFNHNRDMTRAHFRRFCVMDINHGHRAEVDEAEKQLFG